MPKTKRARAWRSTKPAYQEPLIFNRAVSATEDDVSEAELEAIEQRLALLESAESEMGCDYPEGPMSPNGCLW